VCHPPKVRCFLAYNPCSRATICAKFRSWAVLKLAVIKHKWNAPNTLDEAFGMTKHFLKCALLFGVTCTQV
jgi:hypothetical protein